MRVAGLARERRRHGEERRPGFRERAIERGKPHVVAHRQPEPAPRQLGHHGKLARPVGARLPIALAIGEINVEHVDLVVARGDVAFAVDQE